MIQSQVMCFSKYDTMVKPYYTAQMHFISLRVQPHMPRTWSLILIGSSNNPNKPGKETKTEP
jgi:hypothetical protein